VYKNVETIYYYFFTLWKCKYIYIHSDYIILLRIWYNIIVVYNIKILTKWVYRDVNFMIIQVQQLSKHIIIVCCIITWYILYMLILK